MGLAIYKSKKEYVARTHTQDLIYMFWEEFFNCDDNSIYFENESDLLKALESLEFTEEEQKQIINFYNDENLYEYDVEVC